MEHPILRFAGVDHSPVLGAMMALACQHLKIVAMLHRAVESQKQILTRPGISVNQTTPCRELE